MPAAHTFSPSPHPNTGQLLGSDLCQLADEYRQVSQTLREPRASPRDGLQAALTAAQRTVAYDAAVVAHRRSTGGYALRLIALDGRVDDFEDESTMPSVLQGIFGEAVERQSPLAWSSSSLASDPSIQQLPWLAEMRWALSVPLQATDGDAAAALVFRRTDGPFSEDEQRLAVIVMNFTAGLLQTSHLREHLRKAHEALDDDSQAFTAIQRRLLPAAIPSVRGLDLAVRYEACSKAGGDYYDFFPLADGRLGILIADVSGHGAVAAVVMAITRALVHADPEPRSPPEAVLNRLNVKLMAQRTIGQFVTAFYGVVDPSKGVINYACAGHPPPRIRRFGTDDLVRLDAATGFPLAVLDGPQYTGAEAAVAPGDMSVWYTDGLTDVFNTSGDMFGTKGLESELLRCPNDTADNIATSLIDSANRFAAGRNRDDDRTALILKFAE